MSKRASRACWRIFNRIVLVAVMALAGGCGGPSVVEGSWPPEGITQERFEEMNIEWRYGYRLDGEQVYRFNLGSVPDKGCLRFDVMEESGNPAPVHVELIAGGNSIHAGGISPEGRWQDLRYDLEHAAGEELTLEIRGEAPFWMAQLELFSPTAEHTNVLVVLLDTMRLDRFGVYGSELGVTPNLDAIAREGIVFNRLLAQSSWTRTTMASIFTATYPETHGITEHRMPYPEALPMFTRSLAESGYHTMAYVANIGVTPRTGFGPAFDQFTFRRKFVGDGPLVDLALEGIKSAAGRPWFTYVHLMGPHSPYDPPEELWTKYQPEGEALNRADLYELLFGSRAVGLGKQAQLACTEGSEEYRVRGYDDRPLIEDQIDADRLKGIVEGLYNGEIENTDRQFARLIETLKDQGEYENTLIVILADHGEGFWEHGLTHHGNALHEALVHVPLIIKRPGKSDQSEIDALVEHVDIAPTIAEFIGVPLGWPHEGRSLVPLLDGEAEESGHVGRTSMAKTIYARTLPYEPTTSPTHYFRAATDGRYKVVRNDTTGRNVYFDLLENPDEKNPLMAHPTGDQSLDAMLAQMGTDRIFGLTMMMCAPWNEKSIFSGTIRGDVPDAMFFRADLPGRRVERVGEGWTFEIEIEPREDLPFAAPYYNPVLFGDIEPDDKVSIEIFLNGKPVDGAAIQLGNEGGESTTSISEFVPRALAGSLPKNHPAGIVERPRVFVWYSDLNAPPEEPSDIDEETAEELRALGYL